MVKMSQLTVSFLLIIFVLVGGVVCEKDIGRRRTVPVIYVAGSHYEVGFDVGRTFGSLIKSFLNTFENVQEFEKQYKTEAGRDAYEKTLTNMKIRYPQYVKEIQGIADGAEVPFRQIFLLHLDDIIETINENHVIRHDTGGCSSVGVNSRETFTLGHTEDALSDTLNHFYIVSAHIIPDDEDRQHGAVEERFASLSYAGQLPGYTSGFNEHGLVFSINTLSPLELIPGNTPRTFITRAALASKSFEDLERVLQDKGLGAANGFSMNVLFTDAKRNHQLANIEVAPNLKESRSQISVRKYDSCDDNVLVHCNKYLRLNLTEVRGPIIDSTNARMAAIAAQPKPRSTEDVQTVLSDISGKDFRVFEDRKQAPVKTICAGIFDVNKMTWSLYINQPNASEPIAELPIKFNKLES